MFYEATIMSRTTAAAEHMWRLETALGVKILPVCADQIHSPEEGDEELHQVHDAVVLRECNLEKRREHVTRASGNLLGAQNPPS